MKKRWLIVCAIVLLCLPLRPTQAYGVLDARMFDSMLPINDATLYEDGRLAMIYIGEDGLTFASCEDITCHNRVETVVLPASAKQQGDSIMLNEQGHPSMFMSYNNGALFKAICYDPLCSTMDFDYFFGLSPGGDTGPDVSLIASTFSPDGYPIIAHQNTDTSNIDIILCDDPACDVYTIQTMMAWNGYIGLPESLDVGLTADGRPMVGFAEGGTSRLNLAVCDDAACSSTTVTPVRTDTLGDSAMAVNSEGRAVFADVNSSVDTLRLTVCNDTLCTAPFMADLDTIDSLAGQRNDLALTSTDHPIIGYEAGDGLMRLMVCDDPTCTTRTSNLIGEQLYRPHVFADADLPALTYIDNFDQALKAYRHIPEVRLMAADAISVAEGDSLGAAYTLELGYAPSALVQIDLTTDGQCTVSPEQIIFGQNSRSIADWNDPQYVQVTAPNDLTAEGAHTCTITHSLSSSDAAFNGSNAIIAEGLTRSDGSLTVDIVDAPGPYNQLVNPGFEGVDISPWAVNASGGDGQFCLGGDDCFALLSGNGATEFVRQTVDLSGVDGERWELSFAAAGKDLPAGGAVGARVEFLNGGAVVNLQNCIVANRGTFDWTTVTCPAAEAGGTYDAIRVTLGWQNMPSGLYAIDDVVLISLPS